MYARYWVQLCILGIIIYHLVKFYAKIQLYRRIDGQAGKGKSITSLLEVIELYCVILHANVKFKKK